MTERSPSEPRSDLGATIRDGGVHFAVWAPAATSVEVEVHGEDGLTHHPLVRDANGLHAGLIPGLTAGSRYKLRLDGGDAFPDPPPASNPRASMARPR